MTEELKIVADLISGMQGDAKGMFIWYIVLVKLMPFIIGGCVFLALAVMAYKATIKGIYCGQAETRMRMLCGAMGIGCSVRLTRSEFEEMLTKARKAKDEN